MNKIKSILIIGITITLSLGILGVSYAFFKTAISGNENASGIVTKMGSLKLSFNDSQYIGIPYATTPWGATKTFTVQNTGTEVVKYNILWETLTNTFVNKELLTYTVTSTNSGGTLPQTQIPNTGTNLPVVKHININPGVTQTYTINFNYIDASFNQASDMEKVFNGKFKIEEDKSVPTFNEIIIANNTVKNVENDSMFAHVAPADKSENGLWKEARAGKTEGDKPTYFFRGSVQNNYVSFAGKMWRIVRINEDGTVKLILGGNGTEDGYIDSATHVWNPSRDQATYVNYVGSTAKTDIDAWYNNNITGANNNKVATWNVCNDKSAPANSHGWTYEYGAAHRLYDAKTPQFKCPNASDNIAVKGGLLTADEVAYAGGVYGSNSPDYYLYDNAKRSGNVGCWWVSSPYYFDGFANVFVVYGLDNPGFLAYVNVNNPVGLRAAISLASDTLTVSGNGTQASPYTI
ncbi:MAG: hypothetical protein RR255_05395 [Bacilli bacterium]